MRRGHSCLSEQEIGNMSDHSLSYFWQKEPKMDLLEIWDIGLFKMINGQSVSSPMDALMVTLSSPWTWVVWGLWFVLLSILRKNIKGLLACVSMGIALGVGDAVSYFVLKPSIERLRPCHTIEDVRLPGGSCGGEFSMPSNHASNAAAIVAAASRAQRSFLWGGASLAVLVGVSRVYLGVHYPSDVLFGWIFGAVVGLLVQILMETIARRSIWISRYLR